MSVLSIPEPRKRKFLPEEFRVTVWSKLKPYYNELQRRSIESLTGFEQWIYDWNELNALFREEVNWRYIHLSVDTENENAKELYTYVIQRILPKVMESEHALNLRLVESPYKSELNNEEFGIHLRGVENSLEIYRPENVKLSSEIRIKSKNYGKIVGQMMIEFNDQQFPLQKAYSYLESLDRNEREVIYRKIGDRLLLAQNEFDELFDDLLSLRNQQALNAGFDNYRDYKFKEMGRFDYGVKDCKTFHESVKNQVVPILNEIFKIRKSALNLDRLHAWDTKVSIEGTKRLEPFENTTTLIENTIECLTRVSPFFGACLSVLKEMDHLDLSARKGKQPGGYNMPLLMTGVPFIFMNASNSVKDLITLSHESGHAIHSISTRNYQLNSIKSCPSEIAELAAMSMELICMEHWGGIFENPEDERIARLQQLERALMLLPWVAQVDEFQHWIYTNQNATREERTAAWKSLCKAYKPEVLESNEEDEKYVEASWHRQLHIFEVPFYYIEYAIAQLGAIAIWKNYRENSVETIKRFTYALSLGNSRTIPEIYEAAGISFDFSERYIQSNLEFLKEEMEKCYFRIS